MNLFYTAVLCPVWKVTSIHHPSSTACPRSSGVELLGRRFLILCVGKFGVSQVITTFILLLHTVGEEEEQENRTKESDHSACYYRWRGYKRLLKSFRKMYPFRYSNSKDNALPVCLVGMYRCMGSTSVSADTHVIDWHQRIGRYGGICRFLQLKCCYQLLAEFVI